MDSKLTSATGKVLRVLAAAGDFRRALQSLPGLCEKSNNIPKENSK
jgi:hypothetical protein